MRILSRYVFFEILTSAALGTGLFTFVLFLQRIGKLFELLVRSTATPSMTAYLFVLVLPPALVFALPLGVLAGILIGLNRMSSDGEILAMRSTGLSGRRVAAPILTFAALGMLVTAAASLWFNPVAIRETYRVLNKVAAAQLTAEIQPRVFQEQFPNTVLFVEDVVSEKTVRWRNIFMADLSPASQRRHGARERSDAPLITVAREAIATTDPQNSRIQLTMRDGSTHEVGKDPSEYFLTSFPAGDQALQAIPPAKVEAKPYSEMDTLELLAVRHQSVDAAIEFHQRLALPLACIVLALVGIPLGVSSRKAGKSAALVLTILIAFFYYLGLITLIGLARQGVIPAPLAIWTPNLLFSLLGILFLARMERPGDIDVLSFLGSRAKSIASRFSRASGATKTLAPTNGTTRRLPLLPQILDTYVLSGFVFYFTAFLLSMLLLVEVFTFFELLSDIVRNRIPMTRVMTYLFFLAPKLIYDLTPVSILVAVLITFGVLSKNNEITAFKATGISLHRLAVPVLFFSLIISFLMFVFDYSYVPQANRIQDAIRNEIKGRAVQTYLDPGRKWIFGQNSQIYYYKYFDQSEGVMVGVSVYELEPRAFRLRRHIFAEQARWAPNLKTWVFQNGWSRVIGPKAEESFLPFEVSTFPGLSEPPGYFLKEVKQQQQMNFQELAAYINDLRTSGFDTVRLQVQFYRKFSVPLFAAILALLSIPFAFIAGNRGAMTGVGISLGIAVAYWMLSQLFEQIGNINQLPPVMAAWAPAVVFTLTGAYLLMRLRT